MRPRRGGTSRRPLAAGRCSASPSSALWEPFVEVARRRAVRAAGAERDLGAARAQPRPILEAAWATGQNALVGLALGIVLGVRRRAAGRRACARSTRCSRRWPAAVATIPIVALTPIFNTMFASTSSTPRRLIVADRGLLPRLRQHAARAAPDRARARRADAQLRGVAVDDARAWCACPAALPFFFTGLRIAASAAVIAAVVSEYFGGLQDGLGPGDHLRRGRVGLPAAWAIVVRGDRPRPRLLPRRAARRAAGDAVAARAS